MKRIKVTEVAKILGVSADAVRRWHRSGILPADFVSPAGHRYYDEGRIREMAKAGKVTPKDEDPRAAA